MIYFLIAVICLILFVRCCYDDYRFKKIQKEVEYLYRIHGEER